MFERRKFRIALVFKYMNNNIFQPKLLNMNVIGLSYRLKIRTEDSSTVKSTSALLVGRDDSILNALKNVLIANWQSNLDFNKVQVSALTLKKIQLKYNKISATH